MSYPENMPAPRSFYAEKKCKNEDCGHTWDAFMINDLGMTDFADTEDAYCPLCNTEAA